MPRNQHAVIWTRIGGMPEKMGDLVLSSERADFTYTEAYVASNRPGFCLLGDAEIWANETVTYPISERIPVFPRLLSLIPGNNPRNLQRRHYLDILRAELGREPPLGIETEWQLLLMGGHGGIGHIDVFTNDIVAAHWYQAASHAPEAVNLDRAANGRSQLWSMLRRNVLDENVEFDPGLIEETLGPTPSVGGMIPKLLVSITPSEQRPIFYAPEAAGKQDVILKVEPPEYAGMLDLESLCLDIHREAGFEVPIHHRFDDEDLHFLAVERFDRVAGNPVPMESLFSIIATGDHRFRETGDILLDELGGVFERLRDVAGLASDTEEQFYRRIIMAILTGNGDLHLDNLALLGGLSNCRLSPVYDPAPMRAWPRHNLVSAIPFDASAHADHGAFFVGLGRTLGLSEEGVSECLHAALEATEHYTERVMALERVPEQQRRQLSEIVKQERALMIRHRP